MAAVELLAALTGDYLAASGYALSSVGGLAAGSLLETLFRKRASEAREILISELRLGAKTEFDIDPNEAVAIVFRFFRAATEGTARLNLGMMAAFITGQTRKDEFQADLFMTWADVIASLRRGEVHLLGALQVALSEPEAHKGDNNEKIDDTYVHDRVNGLMTAAGYQPIETYSLFTSLARTGCFSMIPALGGLHFRPTPIFYEIASLVDIEGVIARYEWRL